MGISPSYASTLISINNSEVITCPAEAKPSALPDDFTDDSCRTLSFYQVDPQHKHLWVKATINLPIDYLELQQPSAFYLFARTSSEIYFNGVSIGQNGTPSSHANDEFVGKMDARFYVPKGLLKAGENEVVMRLSSHHGLFHLASPMHFAGFGEYQSSLQFFQNNMLVLLFLLGVLLLGTVYLATLTTGSSRDRSKQLLFVMAFCVIGQIVCELARGLFNYDYPLHDLRLTLVLLFALGFGLCLLAFCLRKVALKKQGTWMLFGAASTVGLIWLVPGFDLKTLAAIIIPSVIANVVLAWHYWKKRNAPIGNYLIVVSVFNLVALANLPEFHDTLFYVVVSGLMILLSTKQAHELLISKAEIAEEQKQIAKLELSLAQAQQKHVSTKLTLTSTGQTQVLATSSILFCKAAGDYVEIYVVDNKQHLFTGSLKQISEQLPETFMRVHRSYIVNLDHVASLTSNPRDVKSHSRLVVGGHDVPVSRRLLPQVRQIVKASGLNS